MDEPPDVATLVAGLMSESESTQKYAVFRLQGLLSDEDFADVFIQADGLEPLRQTVLDTTGNTQAYALGSLNALLEQDIGWECCDPEVLETAVSLAIAHPLVNIVRNALSLLMFVVSRPLNSDRPDEIVGQGFRAVKPAMEKHPEFLESLVQRLSASDHTLCANALQLVNALLRDAVVHGGDTEWPAFMKRLQNFGVIAGVVNLMRGDAASDVEGLLAYAILDFQYLVKTLYRKFKEVPVNLENPEHKRALKQVHILSKPEPYDPSKDEKSADGKPRRHHPQKWRRLGFETESPGWEFEDSGYLGLMDLVGYCHRNEDTYQKTLLEQSMQPSNKRCPIAHASLSVTSILYEIFEIENSAGTELVQNRQELDVDLLYKPLLLQWTRLHTAVLHTFNRLWKDCDAAYEDFFKVEELVRMATDHIAGRASRRMDISKVEEQLRTVTLQKVRKWQMNTLDEIYADVWEPHLVKVRAQLHKDSLQFMKEQRIRCLLQGSWFREPSAASNAWRFVKLSHNRRFLHHRSYDAKSASDPSLEELRDRIDLNVVTSVTSNVSATEHPLLMNGKNDSAETLKNAHDSANTNTKLTIVGGASEERTLLELYPATSHIASEWLDGLLMLLNQPPITKETTNLVEMIVDWGVRLRILNLRWEDVSWEDVDNISRGEPVQVREVPSREGLDDDYWYAVVET